MKSIFMAIILALTTTLAQSSETKIPGVWGFAVGSTQGTYFRAILEQANREQKKYEFQFEHRPGAGGAIASRSVLDHKGPALLAQSGAFFARPYLYPETPYRFENFRPILIMGSAPAVLMTRNKTLDQLLQQPRITLGTSGAGSSTHLMAETLRKYIKNSEVTMVHFKDTNEAYVNVLGGHIDATFEFLGDAKGKATSDVVFAGITGSQRTEGIEPLKNRGMPDMEHVSGIFAIYVPTSMPKDVYDELRSILVRAERVDSVQSLYRRDFTYRDPGMSNTAAMQIWYDSTAKKFQTLTANIKLQ